MHPFFPLGIWKLCIQLFSVYSNLLKSVSRIKLYINDSFLLTKIKMLFLSFLLKYLRTLDPSYFIKHFLNMHIILSKKYFHITMLILTINT